MRNRRVLKIVAVLVAAVSLMVSCGGSDPVADQGDDGSTTSVPNGDESQDPTFFFTLTADSGGIDSDTLTLTDVAPSVLAVAERPARLFYRQSAATFIDEFEEEFGSDSPNAVLVAEVDGGSQTMAVTLSQPSFDEATSTITFDVGGSAHSLPSGAFGTVSLTVDSAAPVSAGASDPGVFTVTVKVAGADGPSHTVDNTPPDSVLTVKMDVDGCCVFDEGEAQLGGRSEIRNETDGRILVTVKRDGRVVLETHVAPRGYLIYEP